MAGSDVHGLSQQRVASTPSTRANFVIRDRLIRDALTKTASSRDGAYKLAGTSSSFSQRAMRWRRRFTYCCLTTTARCGGRGTVQSEGTTAGRAVPHSFNCAFRRFDRASTTRGSLVALVSSFSQKYFQTFMPALIETPSRRGPIYSFELIASRQCLRASRIMKLTSVGDTPNCLATSRCE